MSKNIHFIAIGGSAMHNLALALHDLGYHITGSDDEIYEPSRSRLAKEGLLPQTMGWHPEAITDQLDCIILGMHAKPDNPELRQAQEMNIPIYSYPEYIAKESAGQRTVVVAGSHGKTTTTAMIMHVLSKIGMNYDYLVGAQLAGFDRMVRLSNAPLIILEGDEYLSSPIDRRPKIMHYRPDIAVITGIAWDHINVFPTYDIYIDQFRQFIVDMTADSSLIYFGEDPSLVAILAESHHKCATESYGEVAQNAGRVVVAGETYQVNVIGRHNMQNLEAARKVCNHLGVSDRQFFEQIADFTGAAKRLQYRGDRGEYKVYQDFAHAPSKVTATCSAVKAWYGDQKLYAFLELHTFSSLNKDFIPQYRHALQMADAAFVVFDSHTLEMKNMPAIDVTFLREQFDHPNLTIITKNTEVAAAIDLLPRDGNLLMMSSGTFGGLDWAAITDAEEASN